MLKIKVNQLMRLVEYLFIIGLFFLSLQSNFLLIICLLLSTVYVFNGRIGILKLISLITIRYLVSPGMDHTTLLNAVMIYKYVVLFIFGTAVLLYFSREVLKNATLMKFIYATCCLWASYIAFGFISSHAPLLVLSKSFAYFYSLIIVVVLIGITKEIQLFMNWFSHILGFIIYASLLYVHKPIGYLLNGFSFQGVLNHPNLFGVFMTLTLTLLLVNLFKFKKHQLFYGLTFVVGLYELFISNSRTAVLALLLSILTMYLVSKIHLGRKILMLCIAVIIVLIVVSIPMVQEYLTGFIQKGQSSNQVLYSRFNQIDNVEYGLKHSPIFGSGFGVPLNNSSLALETLTFEAGNLFFGIIIYTGIIGAVFYLFYLAYIAKCGLRNVSIFFALFMSTLFVNIGEMIMFSPNSMGVFCYLFWGLFLKEGMSRIEA